MQDNSQNNLLISKNSIEKHAESYRYNFANKSVLQLASAAALNGHIQSVKYLMNPNNHDSTSKSSMVSNEQTYYQLSHNAAASGNLKLLKWVLKNTKCDVMDQDDEGLTILHVAALAAKTKVCDWLLNNSPIPPSIRTREGATVLHFAAWSGCIETVKLLMEIEPRLLNMRMRNGSTAVMFATQNGSLDIMQFLFDRGANFGLLTLDGINSLHVAAQQGYLDCIIWLVNNPGLSINCKDEHGATPVHYAAINNRHECVAWLVEKEVHLLKDRFGDLPLHTAVEYGEIESVQELIKSYRELSKNEKNASGFTALDIVQENISSTFESIAENNEDLNERNNENRRVCIIPVDILVTLHNSVAELRRHYQAILLEMYHSPSNSGSATPAMITKATQTLSADNRRQSSTEFIAKYNQSNNIPAPPSTGPPPAPLSSDEPHDIGAYFMGYLKKKEHLSRSTDQLSTSSTESSSTSTLEQKVKRLRNRTKDDLRCTLIQELKQMTNKRNEQKENSETKDELKEEEPHYEASEENVGSSLSTLRSSRTESAQNLYSLFTKSTEQTFTKDVSHIPAWKRELLERKQRTDENKNQKVETVDNSNDTNNQPNEVTENGLNDKPISKVSLLVSQWQNNFS